MGDSQSLKTDPGAVRYGNFLNYYSFNTVEERSSKIINVPENIWGFTSEPYLVLDVGCNCGDLTKKIYEILNDGGKRNVIILGVDIDKNLIRRAENNSKESRNLIFKCIDIMDTSQFMYVNEFLQSYNRIKFDAIFCLSITMWIHLNYSDEGLRSFLKTVSLKSNLLVIEPQSWQSYRNAVRRMKRANYANAFPNYQTLQWKNNVKNEINDYLQNVCKKFKIQETEASKWGRELHFYGETKNYA